MKYISWPVQTDHAATSPSSEMLSIASILFIMFVSYFIYIHVHVDFDWPISNNNLLSHKKTKREIHCLFPQINALLSNKAILSYHISVHNISRIIVTVVLYNIREWFACAPLHPPPLTLPLLQDHTVEWLAGLHVPEVGINHCLLARACMLNYLHDQ